MPTACAYRRGVAIGWQESLFDSTFDAEPAALSVDSVRRIALDARSWLDVATSWLPGHGELFEQLQEQAPWQQRERRMYDRQVLEPRLVAAWPAEQLSALPAPLVAARELLGERYGVEFDSVLINFYRDGRDGVAWHGDTVRKRLDRAVVVTIGLGERRRFLLRPGTTGPAAMTLKTGHGDLIVMGGSCQRTWEHAVPKTARPVGPRISVQLRTRGVR